MAPTLAAAAACYATTLAVRFRTQQAAPLMQVGTFTAIFLTTAYAPRELLADWLRVIADVNPVTHVLEGVRQASSAVSHGTRRGPRCWRSPG